jgi:biotin transport system substrate-specific component
MQSTQTAISQYAPSWLPASRTTRFLFAVLAGSALLAISAHLSMPLFITPVPFTFQPMAVLLVGLLLEPTVAFAALGAYLLEGACGLPVFTPQGPGGILQLMGPSGGFLLSYPFAAFLVSKLYRTMRPATFTTALLSAIAGSVVYFSSGAAWLALVMHQHAGMALKLAVWPFLLGDAVKIILAAAIVTGIARFYRRHNAELHV